MLHFHIPDMDCNGCVKKITEAVHSVDGKAVVKADLETKDVMIETDSTEDIIVEVLEDYGYSVEKIG